MRLTAQALRRRGWKGRGGLGKGTPFYEVPVQPGGLQAGDLGWAWLGSSTGSISPVQGLTGFERFLPLNLLPVDESGPGGGGGGVQGDLSVSSRVSALGGLMTQGGCVLWSGLVPSSEGPAASGWRAQLRGPPSRGSRCPCPPGAHLVRPCAPRGQSPRLLPASTSASAGPGPTAAPRSCRGRSQPPASCAS